MRLMHLPEGFKVELFAAEPQIVKPLAMAFDARGRAWVIETLDYPNTLLGPGHGHDRITICEDADHDGRADKFTVFAEGLNIPTGLVLAGGGLIVADAPDIVLLKDTDGDDKADLRQVLFTGFSRRDTHAVVNNLRYGFDNWIWAAVGYSGGKVKVGETVYAFQQGVVRFRPDGSAFEVLTSTSNNTWGLGFNESGRAFLSTANNQHIVHLAIPNRHFESVRGWFGTGSAGIADHTQIHPTTTAVRQFDWQGGFTAAAGQTIYTARSFPKPYWNRAGFVCEPTGHLVHLDWLEPRGSGFVARDGGNLMASDDPWTAPIETLVGPDGAVWVVDWYSDIMLHDKPDEPASLHGPGNAFLGAERDREHGRIYRIVYAAGKPAAHPVLDPERPATLMSALGHENLFWRLTAQRLLVECGKPALVPQLAELIEADREGPAAIHALWTMQALGAFFRADSSWRNVFWLGLNHSSAAIRQATLDVMPRDRQAATTILRTSVIGDNAAAVRLAATLALAEMPRVQLEESFAAAKIMDVDDAADPWIPTAAIAAAARCDFLTLQILDTVHPRPECRANVLRAVRVLAEHYARRAPIDTVDEVIQALKLAEPEVAEAALVGLLAGWPAGKKPLALRSETLASTMASLVDQLTTGGQASLIKLSRLWGIRGPLQDRIFKLEQTLLRRIGDEELTDADRINAARLLVSVATRPVVASAVIDVLTPQSSSELAVGLCEILSQVPSRSIAASFVYHWGALSKPARQAAAAVMLRRPGWTDSLLNALEFGRISIQDLTIDQVEELLRHPDPALAARARAVAERWRRLPQSDRAELVRRLAPLAERRADPERGQAVYELHCARCHRHGALGSGLGPDLTGLSTRTKAEILTEIIDPNRTVEGNYRVHLISTTDGRLLTGMMVSETRTGIELIDNQGRRQTVLRAALSDQTITDRSLMPEGYEALPADDLAALLEFLTARGKFVPLPLQKVATVVSTLGMFVSAESERERLVFPQWGQVTSYGVPFHVIDPGTSIFPNAIELNSPKGAVSRQMPASVSIPCKSAARAIHLLSGVSGWGYPDSPRGTVALIVRLHYEDGATEDHKLANGEHFASIHGRIDVPSSKLAFQLHDQQLRYLAVRPERAVPIDCIELLKGEDETAPVVMAVTVETALP